MRIVIVSDTHIPKRAKQLPSALVRELRRAQGILHAGDWVDLSVWRELSRFAPVHGVAGNCDPPEVRRRFGERCILEWAGYRIGITHGHGGRRGSTLERAMGAFEGEGADLIVFGHSHLPYKKKHGRTWVFNPGSATDRRRSPRFSFGVAHLGKQLRLRHVFYDSKA